MGNDNDTIIYEKPAQVKKPALDNKILGEVLTLAVLVGRFGKIQQHDQVNGNASIFDFEIRDWRNDSEFRMIIEKYTQHYEPIKRVYDEMNEILRKQGDYRRQHELMSPEQWLRERERLTKKE